MPSEVVRVSACLPALITIALAGFPRNVHGQLEEIIVTAQRHETSLQKTPMSIQAFTGEDLRLAGIDQGRDLGIMVPNVVLNSRGIGGEDFGIYYIRGLPGVGIYVDGVWQGERGFLESNFVELSRVEVLRGPQGTLFGRNTNGGAVNITTKPPGDKLAGHARFTAGEFDRRDATLSVDLPISSSLKTKWSAARSYNSGFLESLTGSRSLGGQDDILLRGDILWHPASAFSLRLALEEEQTKTSDPRIVRFTNTEHPRYLAYNILLGNPDFLALARTVEPAFSDPPKQLPTNRFTPESHEPRYPGGEVGKWQTKSNTAEDGTAHYIRSATLILDWNPTDQFSIEAVTAVRNMDRRSSTDRDGSELTISGLEFRTREQNFSEEVHVRGRHLHDRIDWLAGLFYLRQELMDRRHAWLMWEFVIPRAGPAIPQLDREAVQYVRNYGALLNIAGLAPSFATPRSYPGFTPFTEASDSLTGGESEDRGFLGEVTVGATQRLDLTFGMRIAAYDGEGRGYVATQGFRPPQEWLPVRGDPFAGIIETVEEEDPPGNVTTNRVAATYDLDDDLMLYASFTEGFTSGEFVTSPFLAAPILLDPEIVSTRELGLRSSWLEGRMRVNVTYFASDWDGLRVPTLPDDPSNPGQKLPIPILTSDGLAKAEGWELELIGAAGTRWLLSAGIGLLDMRYLYIGDPDPSGINGLQPWSPFAYAPDVSASFSAQYALPLADGAHVLFVASYGWMDEYVRAAANQWIPLDANGKPAFEPAYGVLNARMRFVPAARRWSVDLWGRNLTDAWYVNGGIDARTVWGFEFATVGAAREVGLSFEIAF